MSYHHHLKDLTHATFLLGFSKFLGSEITLGLLGKLLDLVVLDVIRQLLSGELGSSRLLGLVGMGLVGDMVLLSRWHQDECSLFC